MNKVVLQNLSPQILIPGIDNISISSFWSWAYSDILSNRNRSIFAEFIVATALDCLDKPRMEWDACDLRYKNKKIEVKSAAYLQSWYQKTPSVIRFDISKKRTWHPESNILDPDPVRYSDIYVFCLYPETDPAKSNVLDVNAWAFYVLPTGLIEKECVNQKSMGLKMLQKICESVKYAGLRKQIDVLIQEKS